MSLHEKIKQSKDLKQLLELLIPGKHESLELLRSQIMSFAKNPKGQHALLVGGIGTGKSTVARVMALARYLNFCKEEKFSQIVGSLKYDGPFRIDKQLLDFFEELNLSGLVPTLAQTQLFGAAKGAATGLGERKGIFEQAMYGHFEKHTRSAGSLITEGVVFLDEIGDLTPELQPQLLSVMTGTEVFRVGGEGNPDCGYSYKGSVIAATWRDVSDGSLRQDLLSRFSGYVLRLPGLNARRDDLGEIAVSVVDDIKTTHLKRLAELKQYDFLSRAKIEAEETKTVTLDAAAIKALQKEDWDKRGDLRGLRQVLERSFYDSIPVGEALSLTLTLNPGIDGRSSNAVKAIIDEILNDPEQTPIIDVIRRRDKLLREGVAQVLKADSMLLSRVAEKLGCDVSEVRKQLNNLSRDRRAE